MRSASYGEQTSNLGNNVTLTSVYTCSLIWLGYQITLTFFIHFLSLYPLPDTFSSL